METLEHDLENALVSSRLDGSFIPIERLARIVCEALGEDAGPLAAHMLAYLKD